MKILIIALEKVAGTYSDGKLYTRSKKEEMYPNSGIISGLWCYPDILVEAHPHIGTNKLPQIIQIFEKIIGGGGFCLKPSDRYFIKIMKFRES
jgi:uncharacterized FAD-dependent dehydrogenase